MEAPDTVTLVIGVADLPHQLIQDMLKLHGMPPYGPLNEKAGDGLFYAELKAQYGSDLVHACNKLVIWPMKQEAEANETEFTDFVVSQF